MILKFVKYTLITATLTAVVLPSIPVLAQSRSQVQFQRGSNTATLSGTITGEEYVDYVLRAQNDQLMSVALTIDGTNGNGSVFFNILPPGSSDEAIFNGSTSPERYGEVRLPQDGDYTIRVYLMGNDRDTDKTVGYTVSVTISDQSSSAVGEGDAVVSGTNYHATGDIPCSMGGGQPTGSCSFGVTRQGNGSGIVTVTKLDGGTRIIFFENGTAIGYDQSQADSGEFSATRQGDLNIIRIGQERYEIPDAVPFGG